MEPETLAHPRIELPDFDVEGDKVLVYARGHTRGIQIDFFLGHEEAEARAALERA